MFTIHLIYLAGGKRDHRDGLTGAWRREPDESAGKIEEERDLLRTVIDGAPDGIFVKTSVVDT